LRVLRRPSLMRWPRGCLGAVSGAVEAGVEMRKFVGSLFAAVLLAAMTFVFVPTQGGNRHLLLLASAVGPSSRDFGEYPRLLVQHHPSRQLHL